MNDQDKNGIKKERRVASLEGQVQQLWDAVLGDHGIMNNHLPHIEERVKKMEIRLAMYAGGLAVLAFAGPIIVKLLFE